jgi:hypothetical protein
LGELLRIKDDEPLDGKRVARRALIGEADLVTWSAVYSIPDRSLIARIAKKVLILPGARAYPGQAKQELCGEELLTNSALRLQKPTVSAASGTGDGSTQKASIFGGYSQIEGHSAPRILTGGPVHYSVSGCCARFLFYSGLHVSSLPTSSRRFFGFFWLWTL